MKAVLKSFAVLICAFCVNGCASESETPVFKGFPASISATDATVGNAFHSIGCKVIQRIDTASYEIIIVMTDAKIHPGAGFLGVYLKPDAQHFTLFFQSEMPPLLRQNLSVKESPTGNFRNFKRAEVEGGVLNIYFEHLTIEAPFANEDEYFRYLEEKIWKSHPLPGPGKS